MGSTDRNLSVGRGPRAATAQWGRNIDAGLPQPGQGPTTEAGAAGSRPWAEFRLAVVGHLVVCADRGQLRAELKLLAAKKWKHPISGSQVTFGYSTIERWYYMALNNPDFRLGTLSKKRCDAGLPRSSASRFVTTWRVRQSGTPRGATDSIIGP